MHKGARLRLKALWQRHALIAVAVFGLGVSPAALAQDFAEPRGVDRGCKSLALLPNSPPALSTQGPVTKAWYAGPTQIYSHGILGDTIEAQTLYVAFTSPTEGAFCDSVDAGNQRVFEDTSPRLVDLDLDGVNEVIVVATHLNKGARLEIYGYPHPGQDFQLIAHTPYIGRSHRWLAPIGAADLDGDGIFEIAYIDRPHLAKTLKIWRYHNGKLTEGPSLNGLTNHQIGQSYISGGIRTCGDRPEIITVDANWQRVMRTQLDNKGRLVTTAGRRYRTPNSLKRALNCR